MSRAISSPHRLMMVACLLAACGGGSSVTPPPSGTPASITISAGDQQQAPAGAAVSVAPAVLVRDAEQQPVSGASVQFAVNAGGGSVQGPSVVTNGSGIARVGSWTLGATGEQRLTATVGSLQAVTFHASIGVATEAVQTSIGAGGGSFEITTPGHPYEGLKLTIPAGTFSGSAALRLAVASNPSLPTLPAGFRVNGPVLEVTSSQVRGSHLMTLQVPISHGPNEQVLLAFHDPVRRVTEFLPTVYRDDTLLVVLTTHLRPDLLAGPGLTSAGATLRGADPIGWLMPIAYPTPMPSIESVLTGPNFRWPVLDFGSASRPEGFGPAIPVMQSLVAALDRSFAGIEQALATPGFYADPAQLAAAMRTFQLIAEPTTAILAEYRAAAQSILNNIGRLHAGPGAALRGPFGKAQIDELANHAIVAALSLNRKPLPVALVREALASSPVFATAVAGTGNSVSVVSAAAQSAIAIARQATQGFQSVDVLPTGGQPPVSVDQALPLSSFLVDFRAVTGPLLELLQTSALERGSEARDLATVAMLAKAGLASLSLEAEPAAGEGFAPVVGNTIVARTTTVRVRLPGLGGGSGLVIHLPTTGAQAAQPPDASFALADIAAFAGAADLEPTDVVVSPMVEVAGTLRQVTARLVRLIKAPFEITPVESDISEQFTDLDFTASVPRPPASGYSIEWEWGDGNFTELDNTTAASHEFVVVKDYEVIATLLSKPDRKVLAVDTAKVLVDQAQHWQLVAIEDLDNFFGDEDLEGESPITIPLERALADPSTTIISVVPLTINSSELQLRSLPVPWDPEDCCPPPPYQGTEFDIPLGRDPADPYSVGPHFAGWGSSHWSESTSDQGAGTMSGQHLLNGTRAYVIKDEGSQMGPSGGVRFTGTRNGKTMTGTISLFIWFVNEDMELEDPPDEYRFSFVATRMR